MSSPTFRLVALDTLHEDPANARKHPDRNRATVRASLQEFGQVEALVVEAGTGRVIGGNCRLAELRALGRKEVMVSEVDVHGVDATRLGLVLNRSAETAEWDADTLAKLLGGLGDDAEGLGWDQDELERLLGKDEEPPPPVPDPEIDAIQGTFAILVTCDDELHQRELLEKFEEEGIKCRAWSL